MDNNNKVSGPIDGLKVLDMSRVLGGPYCTQLLGDMGATIIKLEPPPTIDAPFLQT